MSSGQNPDYELARLSPKLAIADAVARKRAARNNIKFVAHRRNAKRVCTINDELIMRDYQRIRDKKEGVRVFISECRKACLHLLARVRLSREEFEPEEARCFIGGLNGSVPATLSGL